MHVLGLTGSIAMGKSYTAKAFQSLGVPVFDSDAEVHKIYGWNRNAVDQIGHVFPEVVDDRGQIDRSKLGRIVFPDSSKRALLEDIIHPLVLSAQQRFLEGACRMGFSVAMLDIPLIFETGGNRRMDATVVVATNAVIQRDRAMMRPRMSVAKLNQIRRGQMPTAEKQRRSTYFISSGSDRGLVIEQVLQILEDLQRRPYVAWPSRWLRHSMRKTA